MRGIMGVKNVTIVKNFITEDALGHLRDKHTDMPEFRYYADRLTSQLISHAIEESDTAPVKIQTPFASSSGIQIKNDFICVVILRSGIAMLPHAIQILPKSKVGFAGIYRDERTALPHEYYWKMPRISAKNSILIMDPMLATGGSILLALEKLQEDSPKDIRLVSVVAAPQGVKAIHKSFPDVKIYLAALDETLNSQKYILPGIGDFGDRYFGTPVDTELIKSGEPNNRHWFE